MLSSNYAKFTQNPAMINHFLRTGKKRLTKASFLDPVWGIGPRADDPRANDPRQWRGKLFLGEALSAVREGEAGLAHPASSRWFRTPTGSAGIHEISSAPQSCSLTAASACHGPPSEFSTYSSDVRADQSQDVLEIVSGVGPGLAEGTPLRLTDAWWSSILVPPKHSSNATCWIVCVW